MTSIGVVQLKAELSRHLAVVKHGDSPTPAVRFVCLDDRLRDAARREGFAPRP